MTSERRAIARVVEAVETSDGAGVRLKRSIGGPRLDHLDPFLLLDEFGSEEGADYIGGFPDHPHRGFETVTYMLDGLMRHQDSTGQGGVLGPGGVQWMTAGRGIVHSEMPEQEEGLMRGFQLWVNLPARDKMCAPRYQNIEPEDVPEVNREDGTVVKVIAGRFDGVAGAVEGIAVDPVYLDVALPAGASFEQAVPEAHNAFVYPFEGAVEIGAAGTGEGQVVEAGHLAVLGPGGLVAVRAGETPGRFILVAGRPIGEPVARYGPFVMNTREEIHQAVRDYQAGRL
ncbi:MAG: pirin family protein [Rhodospirillales bacterium]|nr:pirin family protein [Rhodospirillales bacterium]MDH3919029.1 pirin family protein [Rhodospirillales bacterium]MDH3968101.1 pirin family protein [Rhodospirillales bacterium]